MDTFYRYKSSQPEFNNSEADDVYSQPLSKEWMMAHDSLLQSLQGGQTHGKQTCDHSTSRDSQESLVPPLDDK